MTHVSEARASPGPDAGPVIHFGAVPQRVLVTGGTGFIGQLLVRALLRDGYSVLVWTRDARAASARFGGAVRCVERLADIPDASGCDVVINLAGARIVGPPWTEHRKQVLMRSRVGLTRALVDWIGASARKPWLMLSASAIGYYGVQPQGDATQLDEDAPPKDIFMSRLCSEWEQAARAATGHGVQVVCMRFGLVLGHQGSLPPMLMPISLGLGGRLGSGRQWMSWIHVRDLLRAMAHVWAVAARSCDARVDGEAPFEACNFTAPGALTQEDFARTAARVLRRPFWLPVPAAPVRLLLGEQADLLLEGQRVIPRRLDETGFRFDFPDARSALEDLCGPRRPKSHS